MNIEASQYTGFDNPAIDDQDGTGLAPRRSGDMFGKYYRVLHPFELEKIVEFNKKLWDMVFDKDKKQHPLAGFTPPEIEVWNLASQPWNPAAQPQYGGGTMDALVKSLPITLRRRVYEQLVRMEQAQEQCPRKWLVVIRRLKKRLAPLL
jgi:hypothetical protein